MVEALQRQEAEEKQQFEALLAEQRTAQPQTGPRQPAVRPAAPARVPAELVQARERVESVRAQIALLDKEIANRTTADERMRGDLTDLRARIERLPLREQEINRITRDYEISKGNYQALLAKKLAAEMATDMERRQKSERFTIIDPARPPLRPFAPNRRMLYAGGSLVGLALGLGLAFANEFRRNVLLGDWEFPRGTVVLASLPRIRTQSAGRFRRMIARWKTAPAVPAAEA
jgi:uncharacterized protein involved in exopolysaccharide biosynthesis